MIGFRTLPGSLALALVGALLAPRAARAVRDLRGDRCGSVNGGGIHCGDCPRDDQAINDYVKNLINQCDPRDTQVIYDLDHPFPADPNHPTSSVVIRANPVSPCANMTDTTPPLPDEATGALKVPINGIAVGCWSPPDKDGCRVVKFLNGGSMCMHIADERLGSGCTGECANVSTEQIAISTAGAAEHFVCPPRDEATSCRSQRSPGGHGREKFRLWFGGFCATNGCADPGGSPTPDDDTCVAGWGATYLGYAVGKSRPLGPGWYDWKSGAFKVDYRNGKTTCGTLGACLGEGNGNPWDLSIVATPRPGQIPPCLGGQSVCNPTACFQ